MAFTFFFLQLIYLFFSFHFMQAVLFGAVLDYIKSEQKVQRIPIYSFFLNFIKVLIEFFTVLLLFCFFGCKACGVLVP